MIYIISIFFFIVGLIVSNTLKSKFTKYGKIRNSSGLTGKEIAEKMLKQNGIYDVKIISVEGSLTDHYNPINKTVNLSPEVYSSNSISAAAVAAHECGHALQHAKQYSMLQLRSALVPIQNISGTLLNIIVVASMFGGAFLFQTFPTNTILTIIILCYGVITLFSLITLPVEFDASDRALIWLKENNITSATELPYAKDALKWAGMTYLVAAIASLTTLLYYISLLTNRRD